MAENIYQVYEANPVIVIGDTDLFYNGVDGTTDGAINGANLRATLGSNFGANTYSYSSNYALTAISNNIIVIPSNPSYQFNLPDMLTSSWPVGRPFTIFNVQSFAALIGFQDDSNYGSMLPGEVWTMICTHKSTVNGTFAVYARGLSAAGIPPYLNYTENAFSYVANQVLTELVGFLYLEPASDNLTITFPDMTTVPNVLNSIVTFQNASSLYTTKLLANDGITVIDTMRPSEITNCLIIDKSTADGQFVVTKAYLPLSQQGIDIFDKLIPAITNGATKNQLTGSANGNNAPCFTFTNSGYSYVSASMGLPIKFGNTTYGIKLIWNCNDTSGDAVVWYIQAVYRNANDAFDIAFGTPISITSSGTATAYQTIITGVSSAIVPANSDSSANVERFVEFRIYRNGGGSGDTLAASANLLGAILYFNLIGANDLGTV